jgi:hypothetical protein
MIGAFLLPFTIPPARFLCLARLPYPLLWRLSGTSY